VTASATAPSAITAQDLCEAIRRRYEAPEWHLESEVTIERRRLDVVAFNMWGARQWRIVGFEIKTRRGDWLRETQSFQKSEGWLAVCDAFYVVTTPGLVKTEELPQGWGHLELAGTRLMTRRAASTRDPLKVFPRELAARFIVRMAKEVDVARRNENHKLRVEISQEIEASVRQRYEERHAATSIENERKAGRYDELIKALGLQYDWRPDERALRLVKLLARLRADRSFIGQIERLARSFDEPLQNLKEIAAELAIDDSAAAVSSLSNVELGEQGTRSGQDDPE
jgi:hypothetical protein